MQCKFNRNGVSLCPNVQCETALSAKIVQIIKCLAFVRNSFRKSSFVHIPPDLMQLLIAMATIVYSLFTKLCIPCIRAASRPNLGCSWELSFQEVLICAVCHVKRFRTHYVFWKNGRRCKLSLIINYLLFSWSFKDIIAFALGWWFNLLNSWWCFFYYWANCTVFQKAK